MIKSVEEMIRQYVSAWNEKNLKDYNTEFAKCWAPEATYTDPNYENVKGVDGLAAMAYNSLDAMPSRKFYIGVLPQYHHNAGRYSWKVDINGETREGFDYFEFNENYQITRLVSFFGPLG